MTDPTRPLIRFNEITQAALLIRHLYVDLEQYAGGPLHIVLDDHNIDDEFLTEQGDRYAYLFDGRYERYAQAGDTVTLAHREAVRDTCEQILAILRRLSVEDRMNAIRKARV